MNKLLSGAALALAAALAAPAHATTVALAADGQWVEFDVDNTVGPSYSNAWIDYTDGSALSFTFTVAPWTVGTLTVVDAGFAGDTFTVTANGATLGTTSAVATGTTAGNLVFSFDAAYADPSFSNGVFTLQAGTYTVTGSLLQSVLIDGSTDELDATLGGIRLTTAAVPEPTGSALLLAGLGALALAFRRRSAN